MDALLAGSRLGELEIVVAANGCTDRTIEIARSYGDRVIVVDVLQASKHAALGYVRSLAADLAPHGVTANAVLPGSTRTRLLERTAAAYGLASVEDFAAHQRLGRLLEPVEVAAAVTWLCSAAASGTTGTAIAVDGGFTG